MVASSVEIASLPDGVPYPNTEDSPAITVIWSGGTGPFNVEYTWDDDPLFGDANGNQQTVTNNSVTSPDTAAPPSALADTSDGTTWYIRANVVDTDDSGELADSHEFTYFAPNPSERQWLYLLGNVGVAFDPTDGPDWGTAEGGTQGADGHTRDDFNRYLYWLGSVGVGFTPTDDPVDGWGTGGTEGPDGETLEFDRSLYQLANVDSTQPCPFLFRLSAQTVTQGSSLTVYGQGLVSDSSPTADSWDAEVRLYETTDLDGTFQVLAITDWTAGTTEDSITVSIPSNATSGFIAVVHTTGATCDGSNFIGVNVLSVEADREAGWWVEIWNLRNSQKIITALPDVAEADIEHIPGDTGKGHILLPQNHPDIADIIDRTASPQVQRLVKVYQHNRFSYSFIPDDIEETYSEDGAKLARIYGEGQERMLKWGRALFKDFPVSTTGTRTWLYGSSENLTEWLTGEVPTLLENGGLENATEHPWSAVGSAALGALQTLSRSGSYAMRVTPSGLDDGGEITFSANPEQRVFADVYVSDQGAIFDKTFKLEILDADDNVVGSDTVSPTTDAWQPLTASGIPTLSGEHRLRVTQTAGTVENYWWFDDAAAYAKIDGTYTLDLGVSLRLSRTNVIEGLHSLEATFPDDQLGMTIFGSGQPGQEYTFTLKMTGTNGNTVAAQMLLGDSAPSTTVTLTGGTDTLTITGTLASDTQIVKVFVRSDEAAGDTFHIDDSSLVPGFPSANPGEITLDVLEAMQDRNTLDFVTTSFSRTHDSSGLEWPENHPFEVDPRWTLWDLVDKFQGLGYRFLYAPGDWRGGGDTGWELSLFAPGNSIIDHSDTEEGPAILPGSTIEGVRPSSAMPIETVVYGEGPAGLWSVAELSAATLTALERREGFISNQAARSATTVFRAASHRLETTSERGHQFTANMTDHGDPLPYFDFLPEDALRAHLPGNEGRDHVPDDTYRVAAVMSKLSGSGRVMSWQADFGNYGMYQERIQHLIISRMLEREASENYRPGSGSVSSSGGSAGGGDTTATVTGVVPRHDHVLSDIVPDIEIPEDLDDLDTKELDNLDDVSVPGASQGDMLYLNDSGLWVVVSGTKAEGKIPKIQADGSVAWDDDADSGGGGGGGAAQWEATPTDPPSTGWSWVNQGSATVTTQTEGAVLLASPAAGAANVLARVRSHAASSVITARVTGIGLGAAVGAGLCLRESSTGKLVGFMVRQVQGDIVVDYWTAPSTFSATEYDTSSDSADKIYPLAKWMQIEDDNTNVIFRISDSGFDGSWITLHTVSRTDFLAGGPDQVGWIVRDGNKPVRSVLASWDAT